MEIIWIPIYEIRSSRQNVEHHFTGLFNLLAVAWTIDWGAVSGMDITIKKYSPRSASRQLYEWRLELFANNKELFQIF